MKKIFLVFVLLIFFTSLWAADSKVPHDFSLLYEFVQGGPPKGATIEKYSVVENKLTLETNYIPTQYGSDVSKRTKDTKTYTLTDEQRSAVWNIILSHDFLKWPASEPNRPALSGNQTVTIKANGKTVTHSMWEPANKDHFVEFVREFLNWAKRKMTVEF